MGEWKDNIFLGCFQNFSLSCTICILAPLAIYKNAEKVSQPGVPWMFTAAAVYGCGGAFLRSKIAKDQGVDENFFLGCLWWWCCPCFAIPQEARQLGTMNEYVGDLEKIDRLAAPALANIEMETKKMLKK